MPDAPDSAASPPRIPRECPRCPAHPRPYFLSRWPERIFLLAIPKLIRGYGCAPIAAHVGLERMPSYLSESLYCVPPFQARRERSERRMSLERKVLHILATSQQMCGAGAGVSFRSRGRFGGVRLSPDASHLALDLLDACGMMLQSEEGVLVGREARHLKDSRAASLVAHSAKSTRYVSLAWHGNHFPVREPFWSNPASKRKDLAATIRLLSGHASR
jgi:hypothetical protein